MGVKICSVPDPAYALPVEELGVRVYSAGELCYCILNYPILFLDRFASEQTYRFLKDGAKLPELSRELSGMDQNDPDGIICRFVECCGYADAREASRFRGRTERLRKLTEAEYLRQKGDLLFTLKKFGRAAAVYERIVNAGDMPGLTGNLKGLVLFSEGSAWANLFLADRAAGCYGRAYGLLKNRAILKRIYFLSKRTGKEELFAPYAGQAGDRERLLWDREYEAALERASAGPGKQEVQRIFDGDPVQREKREREAIRARKAAYRAMF